MKTCRIASVLVSTLLAVAGSASAQHSAGGAASAGTATASGGGSNSGGGSSGGGSDSGSGGGGAMASGTFIAGHRAVVNPARVSANSLNGVFTNYSQLSVVPAYGRPRNGQPIIGTAILRSEAPAPAAGGGISFIEGTYNPWFYGYDGIAGAPLYGLYDPFAFDFADPIGGGTVTSSTPSEAETGVLHFNVKPRDAEVYVDGARAGKADQFDGLLHRLHLEAGVHRVELRAPGYQPLVVNVRIQAGESITYRGVLEKDAK